MGDDATNESVPLLPIKHADENKKSNNSINSSDEFTERKSKVQFRYSVIDRSSNVIEDTSDIIKLGIPIFVAMVSWIGMKTTDTALLGHVGAEALSASALADLYTMCTGVLIRGQVLGILVSQAVGAGNHKLAGVYLQVSYAVLSVVAIFTSFTWLYTEQVWRAMGQNSLISRDAGYYATILAISIPGQVAFGQLSQFFSSQRIMHPEVTSSLVAMTLNLVLGLIFVLGIPIPGFTGFKFAACPIVTTVVVYIQIIVMWYVYCYRQKLHAACWNGWSWKEITLERVRTFSELYVPSALGLASDFWRMGIIGAMAARIGEVEVGVFNTSYRIIWIVIVFTSSIVGAAGIKIGYRLGRGDPKGAKRAAFVGIYLALNVLLLLSLGMSFFMRALGRIYTEDEIFLDLFEECRWPFTATLFFMNLAVAIEKIPVSMGRTSEVFWLGFIGSWFGQVPGAYLLTRYWRYDLVGLYTGVALGYILLVILYTILTWTSDWRKYSDIAISRSEAAS